MSGLSWLRLASRHRGPRGQHRREKYRGAFIAQVAFVSALAMASPSHTAKAVKFACKVAVHHHSDHPGLPCLGDPVLAGAARNRAQWPPNSHSRDQRRKEWPLHRAFHLTSHHLLGFIWLHVSIVLHHLLQPCLATSHLRRIEGICVVLQDSQLEEGKGRRRVRILPAFLGGCQGPVEAP